ncbi:hypothetical protein LDENG_00252810, partial [Lucifuga dentata]
LLGDKEEVRVEEEEEEEERILNYTPPAQKSLQEIQDLDQEDQSLVKYKQMLLGGGPLLTDPSLPNVMVTRLTLMCDEAPGPISMKLTGDLDALKEEVFTLKEGANYRLKIHFKVSREIVAGLRYHQMTMKKQVKVDKLLLMVGSYGPRQEQQEFVGGVLQAPAGVMSRGEYQIKSRFIDDDKHVHLEWTWKLNIAKDWNI